MDTFGEWVRSHRNQLRLTREQFADRVGWSVAMLRKIEDGERRPSEQIAALMSNCLNIPPEVGIETKGTFIVLETLVGIASLQAKRGNIDYAFELLLSVINHPASMQDTKDHADQLRVGWEAQLTGLQIKAARERLKAKTFESTVNEVLRQI